MFFLRLYKIVIITLSWMMRVVHVNKMYGKKVCMLDAPSMTEMMPKSRRGSESSHGSVIIACPLWNLRKNSRSFKIPRFHRGQCLVLFLLRVSPRSTAHCFLDYGYNRDTVSTGSVHDRESSPRLFVCDFSLGIRKIVKLIATRSVLISPTSIRSI